MSSPTLYQRVIDNPTQTVFWVTDDPARPKGVTVTVDRSGDLFSADYIKSYVPRLETSENVALPMKTQKDVLGNALEFYGRCEYPLGHGGNSIASISEVDIVLTFSDLTDITVASSEGTSTPTKNGDTIEWLAGTIEKLTLSNGSIYKMSETNGVIAYDTVNTLHGEWQGTLTALWDTSDTQRPNNLLDGFDLWIKDSDGSLLRVPFKTDGTSIKTNGDTVTGYTWDSRQEGSDKRINQAETTYTQPEAPELWKIDQEFDTPIWFSGEDATPYTYDDIVTDYENKGYWFNRIINTPYKDMHIVYDTPQEGWLTGEEYHNILKFLDALEYVYDSEGVMIRYSDGTPMTVVKEGIF